MVGEKRQLLARLAPCTPATCNYSQHTAAPSKSISPRQRNSWRALSLLSPYNSSLISLTSISCALIRHLIHLNLGSGLSEPLIPLHFLLTHARATTEDCTSISFCKTDSTEVLYKHLQQTQNHCRCLNFCISHVHM